MSLPPEACFTLQKNDLVRKIKNGVSRRKKIIVAQVLKNEVLPLSLVFVFSRKFLIEKKLCLLVFLHRVFKIGIAIAFRRLSIYPPSPIASGFVCKFTELLWSQHFCEQVSNLSARHYVYHHGVSCQNQFP